MNLRNLTNENLLAQTKQVVREERAATTAVLHHLLEVNQRRLYAALGFSSLFEYAVQELGYSESSASRRVSAAYALREIPEIEKKIDDGSLNLTLIARAQSVCRQAKLTSETKRAILLELEGKSSREADQILSDYLPLPLVQEKVRAVSSTHSEIKFLASEELLQDLEKLKSLLSHSHPNASMAELFQFALRAAIHSKNPAKKSVAAQQPTGNINQSLKFRIWKRDQGQCTYQDPHSKRRCTSKHKLQIDHIIPKSQGGSNDPENLRLLCQAHNLYEAKRVLGAWTLRYAHHR